MERQIPAFRGRAGLVARPLRIVIISACPEIIQKEVIEGGNWPDISQEAITKYAGDHIFISHMNAEERTKEIMNSGLWNSPPDTFIWNRGLEARIADPIPMSAKSWKARFCRK